MHSLKRYFLLSFVVIAAEILLLYVCRPSLGNADHIPSPYVQAVLNRPVVSASLLPDFSLPENKSVKRDTLVSAGNNVLEQQLISLGLVNISLLDSSIVVNLKYSTDDNFLHKNMYGELKNGYLQKAIAEKLVNAQKSLKKKYPFYSLILYDAVRPLSIQKMMWNELQVPERLKDKYVSSPEIGSLHNFGCAVDISIVNENGWAMDMGTPYDYFGELGHPIAEKRMISEGKLSWRQYENRKLLRDIMLQSGFTPITTEWWHFNGTSLKQAAERYHIVL